MKKYIAKFLTSEETSYKTMRIALAGITGILISFIPQLLTHFNFSTEMQTFIAAIVMALLKPIKDFLSNNIEEKEAQDEEGESEEQEDV